jgi:hypothetical protein
MKGVFTRYPLGNEGVEKGLDPAQGGLKGICGYTFFTNNAGSTAVTNWTFQKDLEG